MTTSFPNILQYDYMQCDVACSQVVQRFQLLSGDY